MGSLAIAYKGYLSRTHLSYVRFILLVGYMQFSPILDSNMLRLWYHIRQDDPAKTTMWNRTYCYGTSFLSGSWETGTTGAGSWPKDRGLSMPTPNAECTVCLRLVSPTAYLLAVSFYLLDRTICKLTVSKPEWNCNFVPRAFSTFQNSEVGEYPLVKAGSRGTNLQKKKKKKKKTLEIFITWRDEKLKTKWQPKSMYLITSC